MSDFRYKFKPYKTPSDKEQCPACLHKKVWTRYTDTTTGELLPAQYGKCERVNNCGHALDPYQDGYAKAMKEQDRANRPTDWKPQPRKATPPPLPRVFIPNEVKQSSLRGYGQNSFVQYLHSLFEPSDVAEVVARYQIGSSNHWSGATVFWYVDIAGNVRAGQIKDFDATGHTRKDQLPDGSNKSRTTWVHSALQRKPTPPVWLADYLNQENKVGCLFGEHLLARAADAVEASKIVAVCESPKTAIIASLYFPKFVWVAVGALAYLTADRCKALAGRAVILWPDLNGFEHWQKKADELSRGRWKVSNFLESVATDAQRKDGLDLADYIPQFYYKTFGKPQQRLEMGSGKISHTPVQYDAEPQQEDKMGMLNLLPTLDAEPVPLSVLYDEFYISNEAAAVKLKQYSL
ncbi:MAG: hypothetical protein EAZ14_11460 [Runella slithyformis]|nr:MAG: hypothetical protein EAZ14_11460 [Runella slithyformis]